MDGPHRRGRPPASNVRCKESSRMKSIRKPAPFHIWSIGLPAAAVLTVSLACISLLGQNAPATRSRAKATAKAAAAPSTAPRRLEILLLGNEAPGIEHSTQKATALFVPALAREGINVSWTHNVADLNAANLAKYDTLMVYGTFPSITPAEAAALTTWVDSGKGLVAIHSAVESPALTKLIGAASDHHGAVGPINAAVKDAQHPVVREVTAIQTQDEP